MTSVPEWLQVAAHAGNGDGLETTRLTLGFIPLTDCAPLVVAHEHGLFQKYGLDVTLSRQTSWASIRDKVAVGALDGAHMLAAMPIASTLGLGSFDTPMIAALSLDLNGNAITVGHSLYQRLREANPAVLTDRSQAVNALAKLCANQPLDFAMVFPFSTHNYLLRYWLAAAGIVPDREVRLQVVPPPYMVDALKSGDIDGYCVGEPWNQKAIAEGVGRGLIADYDIWNNHPEKVFGVTRDWAERHPNTHRAVLMALLEAAQWLDQPEHRPEVVELLAREEYINAPPDVVGLSMEGGFRFGSDEPLVAMPDFNVFYRYAATFPWLSHAVWFITQMYRWGQIDRPLNIRDLAAQVYRPDIYREAAGALGLPLPLADAKTEGLHPETHELTHATQPLTLGADRFCDGRVFDPAKPVDYLAGFAIHHQKLSLDDLASVNP